MSQSILQNGYAILMANDSDLDKYLLANDYLFKRIKEIGEKKLNEQKSSIFQRQEQIESIKKVLSSQKLSNEDIKKYNDIINILQQQISRIEIYNTSATFDEIRESHSLFIHKTFKPIVSIAYGYSQTRITPLPIFGSNSSVTIPINGDFFTDMILYFKLSSFSAKHSQNKVRYAQFPGHRMIKEIRFVMDGIVLDRYNAEDMNFFYEFNVTESQKNGWKRCVGQEIGKVGVFTQDPLNQEVREKKVLFDGYQTFKHTQDEMELFIPLQFWFCNPKFAMSNYNVAVNKTYIEIDLNTVNEIAMCVDYASDGGLFTPPTILDFALYTNHIYTIPEVVDLYIYKNTFNIIRIHKNLSRVLNKSYDMVNLDELRFAVENIMINFRPVFNLTNENNFETWNNNNIITFKEIDYPSIVKISNVKTLAYTPAYYYTEEPVINYIALSSNGSSIYENNPTKFYDSYLPYRYGKNVVITPNTGNYLMTFSLYPHEEQTSGYMNLSNFKDNYLLYSSNYINMNNPVKLHVSAQVINFLYLSKNIASLRFAT